MNTSPAAFRTLTTTNAAVARADHAIRDLFRGSRRDLRILFREGGVRDERGKVLKPSDAVAPRSVVVLRTDDDDWFLVVDDPALRVVHIDDSVVAIDKPSGQHCHPEKRREGGTCIDAVGARFPEVLDEETHPREGRLLHRLDEGTSGVLVFARSHDSYVRWRAGFQKHSVEKTYVCEVAGSFTTELEIFLRIGHRNDKRMETFPEESSRGLSARSVVVPVDARSSTSIVRVTTSTGRRHQVRVHLAAMGFPLVGDALYGHPSTVTYPRLFAESVSFAGLRIAGIAPEWASLSVHGRGD